MPRQLCEAIRSVETFEALKKDSPRDRLMRFGEEFIDEPVNSDQGSMAGEWESIIEASKRWTGPAY